MTPGNDAAVSAAAYCRAIEHHICQKNDGHLMRVVGPSFDLVSAWAQQGVPLKVAFAGIDRYFERYYRKGSRRRPVKIDFCEADVLDVFDDWRRAVGVTDAARSVQASGAGGADSPQAESRPGSLPNHLERVVLRLTAARAGGTLGADFDALIDRVSAELDGARAKIGGIRGEARQALLSRLAALDAELLQQARGSLDAAASERMAREADAELAPFRAGLSAEALSRAQAAVVNRLVRERFKLPTVSFT